MTTRSALVAAGLERDEAYRLVQRNALRAWDEGLPFRELVEADAEIELDAAALDDAFDPEAAVRHVDAVFERLSTLTKEEEPVHA